MNGFKKGFVCVFLALLVLSGCSSTYTTTAIGRNTKIEVKEAADGAEGESFPIEVGNGEKLVFTSTLESGQLKIDIVEVMNTAPSDEPDDYVYFDSVETVTLGPGDTKEASVPAGEYVLQFTAIGDTSGTIEVTIGK